MEYSHLHQSDNQLTERLLQLQDLEALNHNPERSEQIKREIGHIAFELMSRKQEQDNGLTEPDRWNATRPETE